MIKDDGWGKEWHKSVDEEINIEFIPPLSGKPINQYWPSGALIFKEMTREEFEETYGKKPNLSPTHDPYTNPNAHIYYQCDCGAILDPGTKSFASLNNYASKMGWKVRFGEIGYTPYCVECGKDVE